MLPNTLVTPQTTGTPSHIPQQGTMQMHILQDLTCSHLTTHRQCKHIQMATVSITLVQASIRQVLSTRPTHSTVQTRCLPGRPQASTLASAAQDQSRAQGGSGQPHAQHQHQHHHYPGPHCQGASGYLPGSYSHYGEGSPALPPNPPYSTGQAIHHRPQAEAWAHSGGYGPSHQRWQPDSHYGTPVHPQQPPAWPGTGTGAPPSYEAKDQHYAGPHQRAPQVGPKPRLAHSPNPTNGKPVDFSSPPQMYNKPGRGGAQEPKPSQGEPPPPIPAPAQHQGAIHNPSLAKVQQVMARVLLLHEDVDEFVGKKSDKSYRYLEELLTKELLVLDSVETQGQEVVRQARKEAVQRIQAILDRLEKKAF
uniref:BAG family molecular chaperone regulator 4-like n=1 Tax=Oncorhynchus gorbuscha TaxID=8017 RepID=UPI001EAEEA2B|nr:BAG family molecular chaperone regulator 4-like [Oncorhynchus gorbuscha]